MKNLGKLKINANKILKGEELKRLNGGDCWTFRIQCSGVNEFFGQACGNDLMEAQAACVIQMNQYSSCVCYGL